MTVTVRKSLLEENKLSQGYNSEIEAVHRAMPTEGNSKFNWMARKDKLNQ